MNKCEGVCVPWVQLALSGMQYSSNKSSCLEYLTAWLTDTGGETALRGGGFVLFTTLNHLMFRTSPLSFIFAAFYILHVMLSCDGFGLFRKIGLDN